MGPKKRHPICALRSWKHPLTKLSAERAPRPEKRSLLYGCLLSLLSSRNCSSSGQRKISTHDRIWMTHKKTNTPRKGPKNSPNARRRNKRRCWQSSLSPIFTFCIGFNKFWSAVQRSTHRNNNISLNWFPLLSLSIIIWSTLLLRQVQVYIFGRRSGLNTPLCVMLRALVEKENPCGASDIFPILLVCAVDIISLFYAHIEMPASVCILHVKNVIVVVVVLFSHRDRRRHIHGCLLQESGLFWVESRWCWWQKVARSVCRWFFVSRPSLALETGRKLKRTKTDSHAKLQRHWLLYFHLLVWTHHKSVKNIYPSWLNFVNHAENVKLQNCYVKNISSGG